VKVYKGVWGEWNLDDWLTVHRSITLVNFQIDAQNSYLFVYKQCIKLYYLTFYGETIPEAASIQLQRRPPEDEQGNAGNM
jgi:hypothetical protein